MASAGNGMGVGMDVARIDAVGMDVAGVGGYLLAYREGFDLS